MTAARNRIFTQTPSGIGRPNSDDSAPPLDALAGAPLLLSAIRSPADLARFSLDDLKNLAEEIRYVLCRLSETRSVHFASNLGVVELAIALHATFDFTHDRLIWDTGHQCYPHKLLTGRFAQFETMRTFGGLMGYPNPEESPYDLFMTGHAGCSVGSAVGITVADSLLRGGEDRHTFAVIGDGALASGTVFEAFNHAGGLRQNVTIILNDNKMSICRRVGGLARYLDRLRMAKSYLRFKESVHRLVDKMPNEGFGTGQLMSRIKTAVKAGFLGGMLFEEFGLRYIGPIDGHDIALLQKSLRQVRAYREPTLLHVLTEKGHGFRAAELDPSRYHAPSPKAVSRPEIGEPAPDADKANTEKAADTTGEAPHASQPVLPVTSGKRTFSCLAREAIFRLMKDDRRFCVITAAMTQGNMLEPIRSAVPDRFFDVGICESHAVVFAAGLARAGMRPIVDIYSTFLQRAYDHIFQEVSLQNLPVIFMIDRAGVVGADGPTHHGVFDLAYLRPFPNIDILAPALADELEPMLRWAAEQKGPVALRYPRQTAPDSVASSTPIRRGRADLVRPGADGAIVAAGAFVEEALAAAQTLAGSRKLDLGVINARFIKPLDRQTILDPLRRGGFLVTVEDGMLAGGFGSAVLEAACDEHLDTTRLTRLGIGDQYVPHGTRRELLRLLEIDAEGIAAACAALASGTDGERSR